jgi:hypothetical protein
VRLPARLRFMQTGLRAAGTIVLTGVPRAYVNGLFPRERGAAGAVVEAEDDRAEDAQPGDGSQRLPPHSANTPSLSVDATGREDGCSASPHR